VEVKVMKKIQIGISDFKELIQGNYYFVDKSMFIKEFIDDGSKVMLIPRPRRFGKTLNMSMLKYFFSNIKNETNLFKGLEIEKEKEIMTLQGQFPVLFFSFKEAKAKTYEEFIYKVKEILAYEYEKHSYLLESTKLSNYEKEEYKRFMERKAEDIEYETSIKRLMNYLNKHFDKEVIVLIDEYDIPIQDGYLHDYYEKVVGFMRNLLSAALKDNINLYKGILTGILRVSKESIFSGLNNIIVYNLTMREYSSYFGFTENEVVNLLNYFNVRTLEELKKWYNGYRFGELNIYNPWSILNAVKFSNDILKPYWANTSSNDLIKDILANGSSIVKVELESLINGEKLIKVINDNIVMNEITQNAENLWSFLLFSGYLRAENTEARQDRVYCTLDIPNREVKYIYEEIISKWFRDKVNNDEFSQMLKALTLGDMETFEMIFEEIIDKTFSYFDVSGESEKFYHGFVLGMLVALKDTHEVKSNKESGYGRYDVMIIPKDKKQLGIIIEFKKVNKKRETLESAVDKALKQIEDKNYESELLNMGIKNILKIAMAFEGKKVSIKERSS
jgi:pyruvoyl-dependent arginine decarboxylase (PvlArgDC)